MRAAVPVGGDIILESTPNGAGGVFYEEWQHAPETGYTRHFFPWWYDDEYRDKTGLVEVRPLSPEEEELVKRAGLGDAQIAWRRSNRAQLRGLAAQEYAEDPVSCFLASGECIFELEAIERALDAQANPTSTSENGRLTVWFEPRYGRQYIVGVDPAGGGTEGDYACAEVIDRQTAMQCAELHGHYSPRDLAMKLIDLGRMYNTALLVVERNNHGHGVLANLRAAGYQKVYRDGAQDGWLTSGDEARHDREPGGNPRDQAAVVSEHKAADRVQDIYSEIGRRVKWSVGQPRRLRDGDGHCAGGSGSGGRKVALSHRPSAISKP